MALDAYQPCPCGSGQKVKFCCSKDIAGDLEKALRALEGEQRLAGLDKIKSLLEQHGDLACLLVVKANTELELGEVESAKDSVQRLLVADPNNPNAYGQSAFLATLEDDADAAVAHLQEALIKVTESMPVIVYEAIGGVGQLLLRHRQVMSARAHFLLQAALGGEQDTRALSILMRMNSIAETPLLLKQDFAFDEAPEGAEWAEKFEELMKEANRGVWKETLGKLQTLSKQHPQAFEIKRNIAILQGWLADEDGAVAAWREYSTTEGVGIDDAVEAEALAQLLDAESHSDTIDELVVTYGIPNTDLLTESLITSHAISKMPVDPAQFATDDSPPPKAVYWLLDQDLPESGEGLTLANVPSIIGEIYVYGKETDRDARLEFNVRRTPDYDARLERLTSALGDLITDKVKESVEGVVPAVSATLSWSWRLPDDTPAELRQSLMEEKRREMMFTKWPTLTLPVLGGKSAEEAAKDESLQTKVLAAILVLDLESQQNQWNLDFNELRSSLGLPVQESIDPWSCDASKVSLARVARLDLLKLSDEDLVKVYRRSVMMVAIRAIHTFANEVLSRDSMKELIDRSEAYGILSKYSQTPEDAYSNLDKAKEEAVANGKSPAQWLLAELSLRLSNRDVEKCDAILQTIRANHMEEPGIAQSLYELLVRFGVIQPQAMPGMPGGGMPGGPMPGTPMPGGPAMAAPAPAQDTGGVWTPDGGGSPPPADDGEGKSKLWVPGMD